MPARVREALRLARALSDPWREATALGFGQHVSTYRGEYRAAQAEAETLSALALAHGFAFSQLSGASRRAQVLTLLGELDEGIAGLRAVLDTYRTTGIGWTKSEVLAVLARALGRAGQAEEGLAVADEARAFVASGGERYYEAEIRRIRGVAPA